MSDTPSRRTTPPDQPGEWLLHWPEGEPWRICITTEAQLATARDYFSMTAGKVLWEGPFPIPSLP